MTEYKGKVYDFVIGCAHDGHYCNCDEADERAYYRARARTPAKPVERDSEAVNLAKMEFGVRWDD